MKTAIFAWWAEQAFVSESCHLATGELVKTYIRKRFYLLYWKRVNDSLSALVGVTSWKNSAKNSNTEKLRGVFVTFPVLFFHPELHDDFGSPDDETDDEIYWQWEVTSVNARVTDLPRQGAESARNSSFEKYLLLEISKFARMNHVVHIVQPQSGSKSLERSICESNTALRESYTFKG